jgi:hypothetical protein
MPFDASVAVTASAAIAIATGEPGENTIKYTKHTKHTQTHTNEQTTYLLMPFDASAAVTASAAIVIAAGEPGKNVSLPSPPLPEDDDDDDNDNDDDDVDDDDGGVLRLFPVIFSPFTPVLFTFSCNFERTKIGVVVAAATSCVGGCDGVVESCGALNCIDKSIEKRQKRV